MVLVTWRIDYLKGEIWAKRRPWCAVNTHFSMPMARRNSVESFDPESDSGRAERS